MKLPARTTPHGWPEAGSCSSDSWNVDERHRTPEKRAWDVVADELLLAMSEVGAAAERGRPHASVLEPCRRAHPPEHDRLRFPSGVAQAVFFPRLPLPLLLPPPPTFCFLVGWEGPRPPTIRFFLGIQTQLAFICFVVQPLRVTSTRLSNFSPRGAAQTWPHSASATQSASASAGACCVARAWARSP